ncbi:MAG: sensor histidine kinase, partial [Bacteroidetes bacterium]|nr:sensor histidine kinase [Bacteroidota bacterium]
RIYGLTEEERNNQTFQGWLSYIHPEDLETVIHEIEKSKNILSNSSFKHRILRRDGTIKHIHSVAQFEYNTEGFPVGMFGVCHDITDQIEAELALFESETNMRTFINESLMSIYFVDPVTMKIAYSNPALSDLLGYSPEELKLMNLDDFINQSENNITCSTDNAITTKRICNSERQWKRKDGRIVHVLVNSFCHKQNGSNVIYVAAQDISERKKTEEKLEATNKELELFIYKASHDIRGPLASVMGLVNVSKLELQDQKALKYLDMINVATQKLDGTLGELMKAMKMKDVVASQKINFEELIADLIKKFAHFPGFERLTIEKEICVSGTFVSNQSVLETILQNLIENSIKYQRTTGTDPYLKIRITGDEKAINITVKDNGMGIEDSVQSQVFNMYFRANETSKGSGLGLYLVKKGVDKLHGQITLKSKVNQGTTFEVVIASEEQNYMQAG